MYLVILWTVLLYATKKQLIFVGCIASARRYASHVGYKEQLGVIPTFKFPSEKEAWRQRKAWQLGAEKSGEALQHRRYLSWFLENG